MQTSTDTLHATEDGTGHGDGRRPPRWTVLVAHLITLLVLPSGL